LFVCWGGGGDVGVGGGGGGGGGWYGMKLSKLVRSLFNSIPLILI